MNPENIKKSLESSIQSLQTLATKLSFLREKTRKNKKPTFLSKRDFRNDFFNVYKQQLNFDVCEVRHKSSEKSFKIIRGSQKWRVSLFSAIKLKIADLWSAIGD
jgi:hypothetical protein